MAEAVNGGNEVVLGCGLGIAHDEFVERLVVGIGKEDGLDVGIVHADVLHAVFFFVATGQFVLFDVALLVVVGMGTDDQAVLRLALHGLGIDVVVLLLVLYQPAFVLKLLEVLCCLLVDARVVFRGAYGEVDLGLDDVIETFFVVASLGTCLVRVQHVVGTALYLLHQFLGWAYSFEWLDSHSFTGLLLFSQSSPGILRH